MAERLRQELEQLEVDNEKDMKKVTVSVWVSEFICTDVTIEDVMKRAVAALYDAKEIGRNRVIFRNQYSTIGVVWLFF
jgi:diguanylate cyclase (GGDEF)-like protein